MEMPNTLQPFICHGEQAVKVDEYFFTQQSSKEPLFLRSAHIFVYEDCLSSVILAK